MNNLIFFLNWILNWMVFYRYSMFEWIIKIYRPGLSTTAAQASWILLSHFVSIVDQNLFSTQHSCLYFCFPPILLKIIVDFCFIQSSAANRICEPHCQPWRFLVVAACHCPDLLQSLLHYFDMNQRESGNPPRFILFKGLDTSLEYE